MTAGPDGRKTNYLLYILFSTFVRGVAQLGPERLLWEQEAAGSNPVSPIFARQWRAKIEQVNSKIVEQVIRYRPLGGSNGIPFSK